MKDFMMLMGFGVGLVTGMVLYKYSSCSKQAFNKGEKAIVDGVEKLGQKAKGQMKKVAEKNKQ